MDEVKNENNTNELTENKSKTFEPEVVSVKQNNGYQPEVVEVIQRRSYQPQAVAPNTNEYLKQDMEQKTPITPAASMNKEASQQVKQIVNQPNSETVNWAANQPNGETVNSAANQPNSETVNSAANQPNSQTVSPAINQPNNQTANRAMNQTNRQTVNHSTVNKTPKKKKEKGGPNFFVRFILTVVLAVVFGLVAGATFLGVKTVGEKLISSNGNEAGEGTNVTGEPVSEIASEEPGDVIVNTTGALDSTQGIDEET